MRHHSIALTAILSAAFVNCAAIASSAEARGNHHHASQHHRYQHVVWYQGHHVSRQSRSRTVSWHGCWRDCRAVRTASYFHAVRHRAHPQSTAAHSGRGGRTGGSLAAKAREIVASCGSTVISSFRPGARVAGTNHMSLHASGRAVDIRGNPSCIYGHLRGWPGGYSTDYGSVQHVHISLGGREDGVRFSHHSHHTRHASQGWFRAHRAEVPAALHRAS